MGGTAGTGGTIRILICTIPLIDCGTDRRVQRFEAAGKRGRGRTACLAARLRVRSAPQCSGGLAAGTCAPRESYTGLVSYGGVPGCGELLSGGSYPPPAVYGRT